MSLQMTQFFSILWLSTIPLYIYIYHIFFIHSSIVGHLGCFHILVIVTSAAVDIGVHVSFQISVFILFLAIYSGVGLLDPMVGLLFVFCTISLGFDFSIGKIYTV